MNHTRILCFLVIALICQSCFKAPVCGYKDKNVTASAAEIAYMQQYFATAGITNVTQHSSGVFYTVTTAGSGLTPNLCSNVVVNYSGFKLDSQVPFDSNSDPNGIRFVLGDLITGIQKTLPLIKEGGTIVMYIPPSLGYGSQALTNANGTVVLPADSYMKFVMTIIGVI